MKQAVIGQRGEIRKSGRKSVLAGTLCRSARFADPLQYIRSSSPPFVKDQFNLAGELPPPDNKAITTSRTPAQVSSFSAFWYLVPRASFESPPSGHRKIMKIFNSSYDLDYSWEEVSTGNWRKYCPWNDKTTHVVAVDTLNRQLDPETGIVCLLQKPLP